MCEGAREASSTESYIAPGASKRECQSDQPHVNAPQSQSVLPRSGGDRRAHRRGPPVVRWDLLPGRNGRSNGPRADAVLHVRSPDRPARCSPCATGHVCWLLFFATDVGVGCRGRATRRVRSPSARSGHTRHRLSSSSRALIPHLPFERAVPHLIHPLLTACLQNGGTSVSARSAGGARAIQPVSADPGERASSVTMTGRGSDETHSSISGAARAAVAGS